MFQLTESNSNTSWCCTVLFQENFSVVIRNSICSICMLDVDQSCSDEQQSPYFCVTLLENARNNEQNIITLP